MISIDIFLLGLHLYDGVSLSEVVVYLIHPQACFSNQTDEVIRVIHLAVSIGYVGEIKAGLGQAKGCRFIFLAIPKGLHNI